MFYAFLRGDVFLKIVNCGFDYHHSTDFKIQRPSGSGDYILLVIRSSAFFVFNGVTNYTNGNSVVIFKKGTPQIYGATDTEFVNDWIHFEADENDIEFFKKLGITFDKIMEFQNVTELSSLIKHMCFEKYSNNKNANQSTDLYFNLIILKISDLCNSNITKDKTILSELLSSLRKEIYSNPQNKWTVSEISSKLLLSKSYLQHQYKLFFNTSIKRDIIASRIEYSKYLLFSTDYTITNSTNKLIFFTNLVFIHFC